MRGLTGRVPVQLGVRELDPGLSDHRPDAVPSIPDPRSREGEPGHLDRLVDVIRATDVDAVLADRLTAGHRHLGADHVPWLEADL